MQLLSIQVGKVQTHTLPNGEPWTTAYVKTPVRGSVFVDTLRVTGDEQHHTKFHGGTYRAVLCYSAAHYALWEQEYGQALPYGAFGENFTVSDLDETSVCLGDIYQIGATVQLEVAQPRRPCDQIYKHLRLRGISQRVEATRRTGWYLRVLQTGAVGAGDPIQRLAQPYPQWTIARAHDIYEQRNTDPAAAHALAECVALEPDWRARLAKAGKSA
jgi:MOSC domain-containing protein YiiM